MRLIFLKLPKKKLIAPSHTWLLKKRGVRGKMSKKITFILFFTLNKICTQFKTYQFFKFKFEIKNEIIIVFVAISAF